MIDSDKAIQIINEYKNYFPAHWEDEKYKWQAVKHFQDNWDINAENFGEMFKKATDKTSNLLASGYAYPRGMILEFAKADDEATRNMFVNLFDENLDLSLRIETFINTSEEIRAKYDNGTWKKHYQNTNSVSTYLWLMYPDKYYIYKYELFKAVADELDDTYIPGRNGYVQNVIEGFKMYDEICEILKADNDIRQMLDKAITDNCYTDPELKTITVDFGFYLTRFYKNNTSKSNLITRCWFVGAYSDTDNTHQDEDFVAQGIWQNGHTDKFLDTVNSVRVGDKIAIKTSYTKKKGLPFDNHGETISVMYIKIVGTVVANQKDGRTLEVDWDMSFQPKEWYFYTFRNTISLPKENDWRTKALSDFVFNDVPQDYMKFQKDIANSKNEEIVSSNFEFLKHYTKDNFLKDVFITEPEYDKLRSLLLKKKNIILQGAPGVGKTFSAKRLAYSIIGEKNENRICMVQFHQNYSYEDFIMGYRPAEDGSFELRSGVFYNFCERCKENPDKPYFFIIDEINRGNLSKIFGELLMLIETDKRGEEHRVNLVYGGKPFYIPENLHIIGMMNTADRSLAMIDYALRRRFSFYTMKPAFENADNNGFGDYMKQIDCKLYHTAVSKIRELNSAIRNDSSLGKGFEIGHSYFAPEDISVIDDAWVCNVIEYEIIPMIEEYWFDDDKKTADWTKALYQLIGEEYDG